MGIKDNEVACKFHMMASRDALEIVQGKWRIPIVISLTYGKKRFGELQRDISDISPKVLSQELKYLDLNNIITRTLQDGIPGTAEYALTPLGYSMDKLLKELLNWGIHVRKEMVNR